MKKIFFILLCFCLVVMSGCAVTRDTVSFVDPPDVTTDVTAITHVFRDVPNDCIIASVGGAPVYFAKCVNNVFIFRLSTYSEINALPIDNAGNVRYTTNYNWGNFEIVFSDISINSDGTNNFRVDIIPIIK